MHILWVSPFLPHAHAPHAGGRVVHQWLLGTVRHHDVTLLCRLEPAERANVDGLRPALRAVHLLEFERPVAGPLPSARIAASYRRLGRLASHLLRAGDFDLAHFESIESGLGLDPRLPVPRLVVALDELGKPARRRFELASGPSARLAAWLTWQTTVRLQRRICRKFQRVLAMSEQDRRTLAALDPRLSVEVLPYPVGLDAAGVEGRAPEPDHLLFVGAMNRDVNADAMIHFCREVLPLVRRAVPSVRLTIVGHAPGESVRRLADDGRVEITGFVPAVEPYYRRATLFVAPLRIGGGIIAKNLDAMAAGCPVVTTSIGNEGIGATPGTHLLVADGAEPFARAVVAALRDEPLCRRLAERARAFVHERFGLPASLAALERAHASTALARR